MAPQRKDPRTASKLETPSICSLLPKEYRYELKVTSNGRMHPGFPFTFGPPPKHPVRVTSNSDLTIIPYGIVANEHTYRRTPYVGDVPSPL